MTVSKGEGREWELASVDSSLDITGLWYIQYYMRGWKAKIEKCVSGRPIYKLCTGVERMEGYILLLRWWDQDHRPNHTVREVD